MESSNIAVKGVRQLDETRNRKMYRSKQRKRHTVLSRVFVESSPAKKDEELIGTCAALPTPEGGASKAESVEENVAALKHCLLAPNSNL